MDKPGWLDDYANMPRQNSPRQRSTGLWRIAVLQLSAPGPMKDVLRCLELVACPFGAAKVRISPR